MRSYWRVGTPPDSRVVMVMPPDAAARGGDERRPAPPEDPFVNVQRYLARTGVRVPAIHAFVEPEGLMVLEDLGDEMLETRLLAGDPAGPLYERAVDQLARLRARAERDPDPACVAFGRSFDRPALPLGARPLPGVAARGLEGGGALARRAAGGGAAVRRHRRGARRRAHRLHPPRLPVAQPHGAAGRASRPSSTSRTRCSAPRQYDLVALLRDSYVELPPDLVDRMLRRYLARLEAEGGPRLDPAPFRATFDLLTVQRKLKDAGRFVFIDRVRGNPGFLPSIPASLRYVREALARRPDLATLREILARHVPELR